MAEYSTFEPALRIAVLGGKLCGKSTFIEAYYSKHSRGNVLWKKDSVVYPCHFMVNNEMKKAFIYEIFSHLSINDIFNALLDCRPNGFILMYSVDDPSSFRMIDETFTSAISIWKFQAFSQLASVLVGFKNDVRDDQEVIESLDQENQAPITYAQVEKLKDKYQMTKIFECSSSDLNRLEHLFNEILSIIYTRSH